MLTMEGSMDSSVLDDIIRRLLEPRGQSPFQVFLSEGEIRQLCVNARNIFLAEPSLLQLKPPLRIVGDIHGQYVDLRRLFEIGGYPPDCNYLFLGNYVDFGRSSLETICLLLSFRIRYPDNIFLLRGNHEDAKINRVHGFYDECKRRFNVRLWKIFIDCFNCLPFAALIDNKIFCIHGGLSPQLHELGQIKEIQRPIDIPDNDMLFDLLWSCPDSRVEGWAEDSIDIDPIGGEDVSDNPILINTFGADKVAEFLDKNDLDLICRGLQVVEDGYEFSAKRRLITLFSAPNFRGEYDNAGAILHVDEALVCSLEILKPTTSTPKRLKRVKSPWFKSSGKTNISDAGSSKVTSKSESTPGVNPSKNSASTAKYRSNSPGYNFKVAATSKADSGSGTSGTESESKPGTPKFDFDPASMYRSKSPGVKRFLGARV